MRTIHSPPPPSLSLYTSYVPSSLDWRRPSALKPRLHQQRVATNFRRFDAVKFVGCRDMLPCGVDCA